MRANSCNHKQDLQSAAWYPTMSGRGAAESALRPLLSTATIQWKIPD